MRIILALVFFGIAFVIYIFSGVDNLFAKRSTKHDDMYKEQFENYRFNLENRLHEAYLELEMCKKENRSLLKRYSELEEEHEILKYIFTRYAGRGIEVSTVAKDGTIYTIAVDDECKVSIRRNEQ